MKKKSQVDNPLLDALRHVSCIQPKGSEAYCIVRYGQVIATNGMLAAGAPCGASDLHCCAHTERLAVALERCASEYQMIQDANTLCVRSEGFAAYIPMHEQDPVVSVPDPSIAPLGDAFRTALKAPASIVRDNARSLAASVVQLNSCVCVSTNGSVAFESWHGFDMPAGLLIPASFAATLLKTKKHIASFGFSEESFTVHFADGAWIKTELMKGKIPNIAALFTDVGATHAWPVTFFRDVAEVAKMSEYEWVYIYDGKLCSHKPGQECALSLAVGVNSNISYHASGLKAISKWAQSYQEIENKELTLFFGENLRGAISHEKL